MFIPYTEKVLKLRENKDYLGYGIARREQVLAFTGPLQYQTPAVETLALRKNQDEPCAKYREVMRLALQFKCLWGEKQLEEDARRVHELTNKER
jgi:hypothetical protein